RAGSREGCDRSYDKQFFICSSSFGTILAAKIRSKENRSSVRRSGEFAASPKTSSVDFFDDHPIARIHEIGAVLSVDVAIVTQGRGVPVDGLRERFHFHRIRHALATTDFNPSGATRGAHLRPCASMLADNFAVLVG